MIPSKMGSNPSPPSPGGGNNDLQRHQDKPTWYERFYRPLPEALRQEFDEGGPREQPAPHPGPELEYGPPPRRIPLLWRPSVTTLGGARNNPATGWDGLLFGASLYLRQLKIPRIRVLGSVSMAQSHTLDSTHRIPATFIGQGPRDVYGQ